MLIKYRLFKITIQASAEIKRNIEENLNKKLISIQHYIEDYIKHLSKADKTEFQLPPDGLDLPELKDLKLQIEKIADNAYQNIKAIVNRLPENTELLSVDSLNDITNNVFEEVDSVKISTFQLVDFYVQNNLLEPMVNLANSLPVDLYEAIIKIKDAVRRIGFGEGREDQLADETEALYDIESFSLFAREQLNIINANSQAIHSNVEKAEEKLLGQYEKTAEGLSIYHLLKTPDRYKMSGEQSGGILKRVMRI